MFKRITTTVFAAILIAGMVLFVGCSDEDKIENKNSLAQQVTRDVVNKVADTITNKFVEAAMAADQTFPADELNASVFNDVMVHDSIVYAVFDGGVIIHDPMADVPKAIKVEDNLTAIGFYQGEIIVAGNKLYRLAGNRLEALPMQYEKGVKALEAYDGKLFIGTGQGLFARWEDGYEAVREDFEVTAMTADENGLWVGTNGQGLYRLEDGDFKKRFLIRDTTIFDYVNALDYNRGFVYVGTDDALYIHDGGRWETLASANGIPAGSVQAIDASGWIVLIGTSEGTIGYFNGDFYPVRKMEGARVNAFARIGGKIFAATDNALVAKTGVELSTIVGEEDLGSLQMVEAVEEPVDEAVTEMAADAEVEEESAEEAVGPEPAEAEVDEAAESASADSTGAVEEDPVLAEAENREAEPAESQKEGPEPIAPDWDSFEYPE